MCAKVQGKISIDTKSQKQLLANLQTIKSRLVVQSSKVIEMFRDVISQDTEQRVPVYTGTLLSTLDEGEVEVTDDKISTWVAYATPESDKINPETLKMASSYAIDQHENMGYVHVNGGTAKFLELSVMAMTEQYEKKMLETLIEVFNNPL